MSATTTPTAPNFSPAFLKKSFLLVTINTVLSIAPLAARVARSNDDFRSILDDYMTQYREFVSKPLSHEDRAEYEQALKVAFDRALNDGKPAH